MHIQQTHVSNEIPPVPITIQQHTQYYCWHILLLLLCVQSLSNLMQTFILTLQEYIFDVHHLVDFPVNVWQYTKCLLQMYPIVQAWLIFMHVWFYVL